MAVKNQNSSFKSSLLGLGNNQRMQGRKRRIGVNRRLAAETLESRQLLTAVTWYLDNVTFDTGEVATGSFKYDPDVGIDGTFSDIDVQVTRDGATHDYSIVHPTSSGNSTYISFIAAEGGDLTGQFTMALSLGSAMTNAGGVIDILPGPANLSYQGVCSTATCGSALGPYDEVVSGQIYGGPRTWHLDDVQFDDGSIAEGYFTFDADSGLFSNMVVTVQGSPIYQWANPGLLGDASNVNLVNQVGNLIGAGNLSLTLAAQMTNAGGEIDILPGLANNSFEGMCATANCDTSNGPFDEVLSGGTIRSSAGAQTWYLENVNLDNGETATGSFTYNPDLVEGRLGAFTNINVDVTNGNNVNEYRIVNPLSAGNAKYVSLVAANDPSQDLTGFPFLALTPDAPMALSGQIEVLPGPQFLSYQGVCSVAACGAANAPYNEVNTGGRLVRELVAPKISSLASVVVAENQTLAYDASTVDNLDTEGNGLTYNLTAGADLGLFNIDSTTGVVTFQTAPSFAAPADANGDNVYEFEVTVTDLGGLTGAQNVAVRVTDGVPTNLTLTVDTATDESNNDVSLGNLSLREAIELANADASITRIQFDQTVFNGDASDVIRLRNQQLPTITDTLHIDGGTQNVVISADKRGNDRRISGTFITDINASDAVARILDDNVSRVLDITAPAGDTITLTGLTITGGDMEGWGGGIINNSSDLVIINSNIAGNRATDFGGGIRTDTGALTLRGTTVSGNVNTGASDGGGIRSNSADITLSNSTISNNFTSGAWGGGVYSNGTIVSIDNSTIVQNTSQQSGGGIVTFGSTTFNNSIVVGNTTISGMAADLAGQGTGTNFSGSHNLIGFGDAFASGSGNLTGVTLENAALGELANNGGPTMTHSLLENSPAINAGDPDFVPGPEQAGFFDQRGASNWRIRDGRMDMGAFESGGAATFVSDVLIQRQLIDPTLVEVAVGGTVVETAAMDDNLEFVVGSAPGNDLTLTVDYSNGYFESNGISFVANAGDADRLVLVGDAAPRLTRGVLNSTSGIGSLLTAHGANASTITFSDVTHFDLQNLLSFDSSGFLSIDSSQSLTIDATGYAALDGTTLLADGGSLTAANGFSMGSGDTLLTAADVNSVFAAGLGSTIQATGDTVLGDANSVNGFYSDGVLHAATHTITINDANEAVLGSLTTLGDGTTGGRLVAGNATANTTTNNAGLPEDLLLANGKNVTGRGNISGNFRNMGTVMGDGAAIGEQIVFEDGFTVTGIGDFENALFLGNFAPGLSPGVATGNNIALAGAVQMELGGTTPGNGDNFHDQINDRGQTQIFGGATLEVLPWNNFQPTAGDEFDILVAAGGLMGTFETVSIDPTFATMEIDFELDYSPNGLTLVAVSTAVSCDFDGDSNCDLDDIDALVTEIAAGTNNPSFDLTGDGAVDSADRDQWLADAGAINLQSGNPYFIGDANLDGAVDGQDFVIWNDFKFNNTARWSQADWNADGSTDGQDFLLWNDFKFQSADRALRQDAGMGQDDDDRFTAIDEIFATID